MTTFHERSAGVIPFRREKDRGLLYLVLHSATVRNPRAKWEFPKGGVEQGESCRQTAAREFQEETGLVDWSFLDGFERSLSYTYVRRGRKVVKTVVYYLAEVGNSALPTRSAEHVEDPHGQWFRWGTFEQINESALPHQDPSGVRRGRRLAAEVVECGRRNGPFLARPEIEFHDMLPAMLWVAAALQPVPAGVRPPASNQCDQPARIDSAAAILAPRAGSLLGQPSKDPPGFNQNHNNSTHCLKTHGTAPRIMIDTSKRRSTRRRLHQLSKNGTAERPGRVLSTWSESKLGRCHESNVNGQIGLVHRELTTV